MARLSLREPHCHSMQRRDSQRAGTVPYRLYELVETDLHREACPGSPQVDRLELGSSC
jgi:hypothetical protein